MRNRVQDHTKRARDEALERLAVKEGRLRVLKLRKEIEAIQGSLPDDEGNDDEGEIPQIVKELAPRYQFNTPPNLQGQIRPLRS
jgi:hypothetical protein